MVSNKKAIEPFLVVIRVVFLYKANYKSSPIQVLFFLVVPCNILRPLAAF